MSDKTARVETDRRAFVRSLAVGVFAFQLGGCEKLLSPRDARDQGAELMMLSASQAALLEAFGEALVPGSKAAGIAHYVDANLARPLADSLLTVKYLDVAEPHAGFYRKGIDALDAYARQAISKGFADADEAEAERLIAPMLGGALEGWSGPPAPLFYLAVRSDAADLIYGTQGAFDRMEIPYLAHIEPPADW